MTKKKMRQNGKLALKINLQSEPNQTEKNTIKIKKHFHHKQEDLELQEIIQMPLSVVISIYLFIYFAINLEIEKKRRINYFLMGMRIQQKEYSNKNGFYLIIVTYREAQVYKHASTQILINTHRIPTACLPERISFHSLEKIRRPKKCSCLAFQANGMFKKLCSKKKRKYSEKSPNRPK